MPTSVRSASARSAFVRRGFTLTELLIVIVILLALGGIVLVGYLNVSDQADVDLQRVQFDQIDAAMKRFRLNLKRWPSQEEGIEVLWNQQSIEDENDQAKWRGPYLEQPIKVDNWGTELVYVYPSEDLGEGFYDLISFGPDREQGSEDDITNHDRIRDEGGEIADEFDDFNPVDAGQR